MTDIVLSTAEKVLLKRNCHTRGNWTDSGHWMGKGKQPNCYQTHSTKNYFEQIITFPDDASAFKWNDLCEKNITAMSYMAGASIAVVTALYPPGAILGISNQLSLCGLV